MSDEFDRDFGADDAKAEIGAAIGYLLKDAAGNDRGDDIVGEIIAIAQEGARGLPPGGQDPLNDAGRPPMSPGCVGLIVPADRIHLLPFRAPTGEQENARNESSGPARHYPVVGQAGMKPPARTKSKSSPAS
jgi:hypothetical protein